MILKFSKYQGSGNDFIMIDNRDSNFNSNNIDIDKLCNRNFGIGADGLIFINQDDEYDFRMEYYNSDGKAADMCGNGARCAIAFVSDIENNKSNLTFRSKNSTHKGELLKRLNSLCSIVKVSIIDPIILQDESDYMIINTGVPHYVEFKENIENQDFIENARKIRHANKFKPEGVNVNHAKIEDKNIVLRTYERGVENETLSCGTGITATAIAAYIKGLVNIPVKVIAKGGELKVHFNDENGKICNIILEGHACKVFDGEVEI